MKVLVLYRPNSEHARPIESYLREYQSRYPRTEVEMVSLDTREGAATASLYDIMQYPAILVVQKTDGYLHKSWQGDPLPLMDEVAAYSRM